MSIFGPNIRHLVETKQVDRVVDLLLNYPNGRVRRSAAEALEALAMPAPSMPWWLRLKTRTKACGCAQRRRCGRSAAEVSRQLSRRYKTRTSTRGAAQRRPWAASLTCAP